LSWVQHIQTEEWQIFFQQLAAHNGYKCDLKSNRHNSLPGPSWPSINTTTITICGVQNCKICLINRILA